AAAARRRNPWDPNGNAYRLPWRFSALRPPLCLIRCPKHQNCQNPTSLTGLTQRAAKPGNELPADGKHEFGEAQEDDHGAEPDKEGEIGQKAPFGPLLSEIPEFVAQEGQASRDERNHHRP